MWPIKKYNYVFLLLFNNISFCYLSASSSQPKPTLSTTTSPSKGSSKKKKKGKDSATSSEEERWLDAIESGKLEEVL